jgi:hypothetical protein
MPDPANIKDRRRRVIRADGTVELLDAPVSFQQIGKLLATDTLDTVTLKHLGAPLMVMAVIDRGWHTVEVTEEVELNGQKLEQTTLRPIAPKFPINDLATDLYLANCRPGTTHRIAGDVVVAPDSDLGGLV